MRKLPSITQQKNFVKILSKISKRHAWYGGFMIIANFVIALLILINPISGSGGDTEGVVLIQSSTGTGTGFLVNNQGYMLTAAHVVGSDNTVGVIFRDGGYYEAKVLFTEPNFDVAMIQMSETEILPSALTLGDSELADEALEVYVIGYPGGDYSITKGIIAEKNQKYLKTDAATNPGNSGGPLVLTSDNSVVGMVVATKVIAGAVAEGQHYAIPINVIDQICMNHGYSLR